MKKIIIAVAAALFAFAVQANEKPAASQQVAAKQQMMSAEECKSAMEACKDEQCKQNLRDQNGCK